MNQPANNRSTSINAPPSAARLGPGCCASRRSQTEPTVVQSCQHPFFWTINVPNIALLTPRAMPRLFRPNSPRLRVGCDLKIARRGESPSAAELARLDPVAAIKQHPVTSPCASYFGSMRGKQPRRLSVSNRCAKGQSKEQGFHD